MFYKAIVYLDVMGEDGQPSMSYAPAWFANLNAAYEYYNMQDEEELKGRFREGTKIRVTMKRDGKVHEQKFVDV